MNNSLLQILRRAVVSTLLANLWIGTSAMLLVLFALQAQAQTFVNGSFEIDSWAPGYSSDCTGPPISITGWNYVKNGGYGSVFHNSAPYGPTPYGNQFINLDGGVLGYCGPGNSYVEQTVAGFTPGQSYQLSFFISSEASQGTNSPISRIAVTLTGATPAGPTIRSAAGGDLWNTWVPQTIPFTVTALSGMVTFHFEHVDPSPLIMYNGVGLDSIGVSVTACDPVQATSDRPVMQLQRWLIPTAPNIQGMTSQEAPKKIPQNMWFTEFDQARIGHLTMPKNCNTCDPILLHECEFPTSPTETTKSTPFKITYARKSFAVHGLPLLPVWFTDPNRHTINAVVHPALPPPAPCIHYSYRIPDSLGTPWDIQWQPKVTISDAVNGIAFTSVAKLWFSTRPQRRYIFALIPKFGSAIVERYKLPVGKVDAFFVDENGGFVWIAATENGTEYIYRMPSVGGASLSFAPFGPCGVDTFNAIHTRHLAAPPVVSAQLPWQVWASGPTPNDGSVRIVRLNQANPINSLLFDTLCCSATGFYKDPNGLFAPFPSPTIPRNRMFITEAPMAINDDAISSNRAIPDAAAKRGLPQMPKDTISVPVVIRNRPHYERIVKPICEVANLDSCAKECIVEQWKTPIPKTLAPFDFTGAILDIDMVGNGVVNVKHKTEGYTVAFHEPRPGADGIIGRFCYTANLLKPNPPPPDITAPAEGLNGEEAYQFQLYDAYPNPFNPVTTIDYVLPADARVTLTVYNTLGQQVATLVENELQDQGEQSAEFDGTNLSSGVYFYRLVAEGIGDEEEGTPGQTYVSVKKMLLLK
ncbi:MAG: T9SS type A sorting domain-containing protein [Ignavibacteriae bacterium]|nr:T9SS type A sorting domain-containing protein [Ignavibacteria bacterium]MBI3363814.1 T9SS type A sorting domain-containing protein [Ignavibacteriota bacterium]